jgi:hypothetical protein
LKEQKKSEGAKRSVGYQKIGYLIQEGKSGKRRT